MSGESGSENANTPERSDADHAAHFKTVSRKRLHGASTSEAAPRTKNRPRHGQGYSNSSNQRHPTLIERNGEQAGGSTTRRENNHESSNSFNQQNAIISPPITSHGVARDHTSHDIITTFDAPQIYVSNIDSYASLDQPAAPTFPVFSAISNAPELGNSRSNVPEATFSEEMLEDQAFHVSPSSTDDLTAWLLGESSNYYGRTSFFDASFGGVGYFSDFGQIDSNLNQPQSALYIQDTSFDPPYLPQNSRADENANQAPSTWLFSQKRDALVEIIVHQFSASETGMATDHGRRIENQQSGWLSPTDNVLSLASMQAYIESYWTNFHSQLPILHKPTFSPDTTHNYLLLALMVMGAGMLNRSVEPPIPAFEASRFANFVSKNLRWRVFMDAESHPPAKLWVIQTLIILEFHEKMNASRELHERAHVYFPTTLTLMRRGSSRMGKWSFLSRDPSRTSSPRPFQQRARQDHQFDSEASLLSSEWWDQWIAQEAAHRAAFAAFLLDATHATMFGHSATLAIHEIQLPLPCDDALWSAGSAAEVNCAEASLLANGLKPLGFLQGLAKLIRGEGVHTNSFGRIILLAGLMSISWQMHQRELYGTSLGRDELLGVPEKWRLKVLDAFDCWKSDYDNTIRRTQEARLEWKVMRSRHADSDNGGESFARFGTILYHHAHLAAYLNVPEVCVFAGAEKMLGRVISESDYQRVHGRMARWATSSNAVDAVYHALRLCHFVLFIKPGNDSPDRPQARGMRSDRSFQGADQVLLEEASKRDLLPQLYDVRRDRILYTPWIIYFAALVLWAYGTILDGPLKPFPETLQYPPEPKVPIANGDLARGVSAPLSSDASGRELQRARYDDFRAYLSTMLPAGSAKCSLKDFKHYLGQGKVKGQRNRVLGLLGLVDESLAGSEWELMREARQRLKYAGRSLKTGVLPGMNREAESR